MEMLHKKNVTSTEATFCTRNITVRLARIISRINLKFMFTPPVTCGLRPALSSSRDDRLLLHVHTADFVGD
jgi:hypothetical protein